MNAASSASRSGVSAVAALGLGSGAGYGALYVAQRAISPLHASASPWTAVGLYILVTIALFATYATLVALAFRGALRSPRARQLALAVPAVVMLALTAGRSYLSNDVWTYVAHGHQVWDGGNPYAQPVKELASTPIGASLVDNGWFPVHGVSPYGPLWTFFEAGAVRAAPDVPTGARLLTILAAGFALSTGWLVWLILGSVWPERQLAGTLAYLWNPVIITELGGEAHNDAAMIFFIVLSLYLWTRRRTVAGVVALTLAALVKVVSGVLAPLAIVYAWRTERDRTRLLVDATVGGCAALALTAIGYAPFWFGSGTFDGLRTHGRPGFMAGSTQTVLYWYLTQSHSEAASAGLIALASGGVLVASVALASLTIHDERSFLRACGSMALVYLVVAPGYWPWYAAMPIVLLALAPDRWSILSIVVVSLGSRLAAPLDALRVDGLMDWLQELFAITIVGVWMPAAVLAATAIWLALARRGAVHPVPRPATVGLSQTAQEGTS